MARSLVEREALPSVRVVMPDPARPEAAFMRAISWLYCMYHEEGRASVAFLTRVATSVGLAGNNMISMHLDTVQYLRTEQSHSLGYEETDLQTLLAAEAWKRKTCGTAHPATQQEWETCYTCLIEEACGFLTLLRRAARHVESASENEPELVREWRRRLHRSWPGSDFDPLVRDAILRLGRPSLRITAFRNRHVDRWRKQLSILEDGFDFQREATLLIEKSILDDDLCVIPISGQEVMAELGLPPGPQIGRLLEEARRHFTSERCDSEDLLAHLRAYQNRHAQ